MTRDKNKNKESKLAGFVSFITKYLTWERITGIAAIITLVVTVIAILPKSETEKLKDSIRKKIVIVEKSFNPEELIHENDSSFYVAKLVEFEQKVLEFCTLWQIMDNPRPYVDYSYMKGSEIDSLISIDLRRVDKMDKIWDEVKHVQKEIFDYTKPFDSQEYPYLSISKMSLMDNLQMRKEVLEEKFLNNFAPKWNKYSVAKESEKKKLLKKALKEMDQFKNDPDYYKVDNLSLEYWIETNKLLKVWKREILKLEKKEKGK